MRAKPPRTAESGFSVIELMIVALIVVLLAAIAVPLYTDALRKSRGNALMVELHHVYDAMMRYHADYGSFPSEDAFDEETLAPLSTLGYFDNAEGLVSKLDGNQVMLYLAPDADGPDSHFVLLTRHAADPEIIVVAVHTDVIAATGGWVDGVYVIDDGDLAEAGDDLGGDEGGGGAKDGDVPAIDPSDPGVSL
jgi:type II secretory pathway pseudopilin PulG